MTISSSTSGERWTLHICKDCRQAAHGPGSRCIKDRRRTWTPMTTVEVVPAAEVQALRAVVHGHVQVIRGMCTDMLDHREIDRALVRLDDAIDPPEEGS